jgi:general secretion pathway protein E
MSASNPVPFGYAKRHGVVVEPGAGEGPQVLCRETPPVQVLAELRRVLGRRFTLVEGDVARFDQALAAAYHGADGEADRIVDDIGGEMDLARLAEVMEEPGDLLDSADDAPIIRLLNALLAQAVRENASDIHIEPFESRLVVRFRVDGVLREVLQPHRALGPPLVSRVKVMARLDIAEKRLPQDGRISLRIGGRPVDVRVSTIPSGYGERVVLRLLSKEEGRLDLEQLGMDPATLERLKALVDRPHGTMLVTGPTGSGKTTTLYAALSRLNDHSRNILTVEDPIEYYIDGLGQTQVNQRVDLGFARGLRAILRQDPDVVMVGEIRDLETAEVAIRASLTGHMVFSTLHTNTAVGAITRLLDMGVERYLLASSLAGLLAQRLVRLLCTACRVPRSLDDAERDRLGAPAGTDGVVYAPGGCEECGGTGYRGRTGIFELVVVDAELRRLIHDGAAEHDLEARSRGAGPSMLDDGRRRVLAGDTSVEELLRVTRRA